MANRSKDNSVSIGYGYPTFQLARALANTHRADSSRAANKAQKWVQVLDGMYSGALKVGSRTPISDVPLWATLEVITGGFATGNLLAGGELQQHEIRHAQQLGLPVNHDTRALLNSYHLSEPGIEQLNALLSSGKYRIDVPEEGALLVVAWLLTNNAPEKALSILDEIAPYFDQLRFFPIPAEQTTTSENQVYIQSVEETIDKLKQIQPNIQITAQEATIQIWIPFYDNMIRLFLGTVSGELPSLSLDKQGRPILSGGRYVLSGGWPLSEFPTNWDQSATTLLEDYETRRARCEPSARFERPDGQFFRLLGILKTCVENRKAATGRDVGYLRLALARYLSKHGTPESKINSQLRDFQRQQCAAPRHTDIVKVLVHRLNKLPKREGIPDLASVVQPITDEEASACSHNASQIKSLATTTLPRCLLQKVGRGQLASIKDLVDFGYISSADMLAVILPQIAANIRAGVFDDDRLKRVYSKVYCAFRRRRSLLLLNFESQVKLNELPWVSAIESYRNESLSTQELARTVLRDVTILAICHFPHAILPNKLLQELRSLAEQAKLDVPLVDEVAADIFMGSFSPKFAQAARIAGDLLSDSAYSKYYGLDYSRITTPAEHNRLFSFKNKSVDTFSEYCRELAGPNAQRGWSVAANGIVIEQQQILTTQNLAALFSALDLQHTLSDRLVDLARACFIWICRKQQLKLTDYHAALVVMKNTAYAWRQMIVFVSLASRDRRIEFAAWLQQELLKQEPAFAERFEPIVAELRAVLEGQRATVSRADRFLGWSIGKHPLMPTFGSS